MLKRIKRQVLKAAFAEHDDITHAISAACAAAEKIAEELRPETEGEARYDVVWDVASKVQDAIKHYQTLRAGPPDPPVPLQNTPRRPIRARAKSLFGVLLTRTRMAFRILVLGHRPATVRYDALDRLIAENCAFGAADLIACRHAAEQPTVEENNVLWCQIARLVYEAIEDFVTYGVENERACKDVVDRHAASSEMATNNETGKENTIPF